MKFKRSASLKNLLKTNTITFASPRKFPKFLSFFQWIISFHFLKNNLRFVKNFAKFPALADSFYPFKKSKNFPKFSISKIFQKSSKISKLIFQVLKIILFIACLEWFKSLDFFKNLVIIFTILIIFTIRKVHPATLLNFNTHLGQKIQYQKLVQL